jgi:predicted nucleic acid-binding protein
MTLVVDASVVVKWFVEEDGREQALQVLDRGERQAPDLIVAEVANVIWKKALRGQVAAGQAHSICAALPRYFDALHPAEALVERAIGMGLALRHPIYDCLYLACAARIQGRLVTADRRLIAALANTEFGHLAVHIDALVSK